MCAIERRAVFKELLSMFVSENESLCSKILENLPKVSNEALQENICNQAFFKKSSNL